MGEVWSASLLLLALACAPSASQPAGPAPPREPEERRHPPAMPLPVELPAQPGEAGVRDFVAAFLKARVAGDAPRARDFLSPTALEQYEKGTGGLSLTGNPRFTEWELAAVEAGDADSWEVKVRMNGYREILFVGPGPDASGAQRPWIVRGARRTR